MRDNANALFGTSLLLGDKAYVYYSQHRKESNLRALKLSTETGCISKWRKSRLQYELRVRIYQKERKFKVDINDIKQTEFFVSHVWPGMIDVKCSKCGKMIATLQKREIKQVNKNVYFAKKQISCYNCNKVIPEGMLIAENEKYLDNLEINDSALALEINDS